MSSSSVIASSSITATIASHTSAMLCGANEQAMPTAMPLDPLTSRHGNLPGRTVGSWRVSS